MASRPFLLLKPIPPLRTLVALCVTLTACRPGYRHKLSGELQQALAAGPADRKLRVLVDLTAQLDLAKLSDSLDRRELGRAQRRWLAVTALTDVARESQSALRPLLEQLRGDYRGGDDSWHDPTGQSAAPVDGAEGHGTAVLSAAVAQNVAGKSIGVAPGARWVACVGLPHGRYNNVAVTECADWMLTTAQPDVLINPWLLPAPGCDRSLARIVDAWRAAQILPVFAAGNNGPDAPSDASPANYALSVGGVTQADTLVPGSGRGPNRCDGSIYPTLVAPGEDVPAAFPLTPSAYIRSRGTSIAAGLAAGAAAILLERHPDATVGDLEHALRAGARDLGPPGPDNEFGYGALDLPAALDSLGRFLAQKDAPDSTSEPATHR